MEMTNMEIYLLNQTLNDLSSIKLKGGFKFELHTVKQSVEKALQQTLDDLKGAEDEKEKTEILKQKQELDLEAFDKEYLMDGLEDAELSLKDMSVLELIIEQPEEEK